MNHGRFSPAHIYVHCPPSIVIVAVAHRELVCTGVRVYPAVVADGLWLALRHRGTTLFTVVNPGIGAGGGLVGESKSEILKGLAGRLLKAGTQ